MNKALIGISGFIIGATVGAFGSFMYLSKKFDRELEERTISIKNTYEKLSGTGSDEKKEEKDEESDKKDEDESSYERLKRTAKVFHDTDEIDPETGTKYTKEELEYLRMLKEEEYADDDGLLDEERPKMDHHGDPIDKDEDELPLGVENQDAFERYMDMLGSYEGTEDIYLITQEDFDNNAFGHTQKTYVIYDQSEDGEMHVMEEDGDEVEANKWHDELGYQEGVLDFDLFDAYDDHNIYIRNDQIATDFEVHLSDLTWFPDVHCISGLK